LQQLALQIWQPLTLPWAAAQNLKALLLLRRLELAQR
jgi:hypothetical protein